MIPSLYKNFISIDDSDVLCKFIDNNLSYFLYSTRNPSYTIRFGEHSHFENNYSEIVTEDIKNILNKYSDIIVEKAKEKFNVEECYVSQIWLVKKLPLSYHKIHDDIDDGDSHLQFAGVIYLNDNGVDGGGEIFFPKLNYEHKPDHGDMILFKSYDKTNSHGVKLVIQDRYSLAFWTTANKDFKINLS